MIFLSRRSAGPLSRGHSARGASRAPERVSLASVRQLDESSRTWAFVLPLRRAKARPAKFLRSHEDSTRTSRSGPACFDRSTRIGLNKYRESPLEPGALTPFIKRAIIRDEEGSRFNFRWDDSHGPRAAAAAARAPLDVCSPAASDDGANPFPHGADPAMTRALSAAANDARSPAPLPSSAAFSHFLFFMPVWVAKRMPSKPNAKAACAS